MKKCLFLLMTLVASASANAQSFPVADYLNDIRHYGQQPIEFVDKALTDHNLVVFDDALHSAYEPFVFYTHLIQNKSVSQKINYLFLETISTTAQPAIDSFLNAKKIDTTLLMQAFQDDYTGEGWRFQTYLDLFTTVWRHNHFLPDSLKIKIIGVNPPIYWEAIHTWEDYEIFQNSLKSRDYFMYLEILNTMGDFAQNKKGIFLTNTRHAYKGIKDQNGKTYWNTTTFFNQWNPGKVYSIRIHNVSLSIQSVKALPATARKSTDGLNEKVYNWVKMDDGHWDAAFALNGNKPVAVPFKNTCFGQTPYIGNHMLNMAQGTTMLDAYDALIFLAPLTDLHSSAQFGFIYTPPFKPELERRLRILKGDAFEEYLKSNHASSFDDYYDQIKNGVRNHF